MSDALEHVSLMNVCMYMYICVCAALVCRNYSNDASSISRSIVHGSKQSKASIMVCYVSYLVTQCLCLIKLSGSHHARPAWICDRILNRYSILSFHPLHFILAE
jgi:hypothetical protein